MQQLCNCFIYKCLLQGRLSPRQKIRLLDLMSRYYQTLFGRFVTEDGAQQKERLWEKVQNDINAFGPEKTVEQWRQCWADLKKGAKEKLKNIRKHSNGTGGGPHLGIILSHHDHLIISICNIESLDGFSGDELGFNQTERRPSLTSQRSNRAVSSSNDNSFHGFGNFILLRSRSTSTIRYITANMSSVSPSTPSTSNTDAHRPRSRSVSRSRCNLSASSCKTPSSTPFSHNPSNTFRSRS